MRIVTSLGAFALILSPALVAAQDMAKPEAAPPAAPASPAATDVPPSTPPAPPSMTVADKVAADWSKYDMGAKGHLTKGELGRWLGDLRSANGEPAPDAKWLESAFAQTDGDKNKKVSPEELTASLSAGR